MNNLLVELLAEELPPQSLDKLSQAFAGQLAKHLGSLGLAQDASVVTPYATPRRLAVHITQVLDAAPDGIQPQKLMPVSVGLNANGHATPALLKKLQALQAVGADMSDPVATVAGLRQAPDGKTVALFYDRQVRGVTLTAGLQQALDLVLTTLPVPKMMSYQLHTDCELPGWSSVNFVRPVHGLVALHGSHVVPVRALGLTAGNTTQGHRFEAVQSPVVIEHADDYADTLRRDGAVIASFADRRAEIARQLQAAADRVGKTCTVIQDNALLDEVTALVERPNVLVCQFDRQFLSVPAECLVLTMKANQKYFPLMDAKGHLTHQFLVVSNISPTDPSAVIQGNERVVRPRLSDAQFFFDQDRKKSLESRVAGLGKVVYHHQLGSLGDRTKRVCQIAQSIAGLITAALGLTGAPPDLAAASVTAARLAKCDLLTDMVGEFPELQGIMGGYYARHDGLSDDIACAIEDHYKPRFAGDALPRHLTGIVVALADKLETLVGLFGIGCLPTGDKDPFALRRHALGVIRMVIERDLAIDLSALISAAASAFAVQATDVRVTLSDFVFDRLAGMLRDQGYRAPEVDAVLAQRPDRLAEVPKRLAAVRAFAALPAAPALASANKRIGNILKKSDTVVDAHINPSLLTEPAEQALFAALQNTLPQAAAQIESGDYTASLQTLSVLRTPVDDFFAGVMVNTENADIRQNRLCLLQTLHQAMNRVADLSKLAVYPA